MISAAVEFSFSKWEAGREQAGALEPSGTLLAVRRVLTDGDPGDERDERVGVGSEAAPDPCRGRLRQPDSWPDFLRPRSDTPVYAWTRAGTGLA